MSPETARTLPSRSRSQMASRALHVLDQAEPGDGSRQLEARVARRRMAPRPRLPFETAARPSFSSSLKKRPVSVLVDDDLVRVAPPDLERNARARDLARPVHRAAEDVLTAARPRRAADLEACKRLQHPTARAACELLVPELEVGDGTARPHQPAGVDAARGVEGSPGRPCSPDRVDAFGVDSQPGTRRPRSAGMRARSSICPRQPQEWSGSRRPIPLGRRPRSHRARGAFPTAVHSFSPGRRVRAARSRAAEEGEGCRGRTRPGRPRPPSEGRRSTPGTALPSA